MRLDSLLMNIGMIRAYSYTPMKSGCHSVHIYFIGILGEQGSRNSIVLSITNKSHELRMCTVTYALLPHLSGQGELRLHILP
jgi:hypothetical protein